MFIIFSHLLDLPWAGDGFSVGDGNDRVHVGQRYTAIMAASRGGHAGLVKELALLGANVNALTGNRKDALMIASAHGHVAVCSVLLDRGAVMTTRDVDGYTALHWSAFDGQLQVGLLLCSKGADLMTATNNGCTPLQDYGIIAYPRLSKETKDEHKPLCSTASERAPTPRKSSAARTRTGLVAGRS